MQELKILRKLIALLEAIEPQARIRIVNYLSDYLAYPTTKTQIEITKESVETAIAENATDSIPAK